MRKKKGWECKEDPQGESGSLGDTVNRKMDIFGSVASVAQSYMLHPPWLPMW